MCFGQSIVHQRAGHELAIFVVDQFFPHGLAQPLGNAALDLSVHQQRIDDVAAVVDGNVLVDLYFTGFRVHFTRANVTAEGEGEVGRLEEVSDGHGVAVDDVDVVGIDAELIGNELGEGGFFPLAVRRCAGEQRNFSGGLNAYRPALPTSCGRGG